MTQVMLSQPIPHASLGSPARHASSMSADICCGSRPFARPSKTKVTASCKQEALEWVQVQTNFLDMTMLDLDTRDRKSFDVSPAHIYMHHELAWPC